MIRLNRATSRFWKDNEAIFAKTLKYRPPKKRDSISHTLKNIVKEFEDSQTDKEAYTISTDNALCRRYIANLRFEPTFKEDIEIRIVLDETFDPNLNMFLYSLSCKEYGIFKRLVLSAPEKKLTKISDKYYYSLLNFSKRLHHNIYFKRIALSAEYLKKVYSLK